MNSPTARFLGRFFSSQFLSANSPPEGEVDREAGRGVDKNRCSQKRKKGSKHNETTFYFILVVFYNRFVCIGHCVKHKQRAMY